MPSFKIRNLSEKTYKALGLRAAAHGRSVEAEIRAILDETVSPPKPGLGSLLAAIGRDFGGVELDIARDQTPAEGAPL